LDAEKRLALQEEKQALEAKLLEVYVNLLPLLAVSAGQGRTYADNLFLLFNPVIV
jgi:hypothetical protein